MAGSIQAPPRSQGQPLPPPTYAPVDQWGRPIPAPPIQEPNQVPRNPQAPTAEQDQQAQDWYRQQQQQDTAGRARANTTGPAAPATPSWQEQAVEQRRIQAEDQQRQDAASATARAQMDLDRERRVAAQPAMPSMSIIAPSYQGGTRLSESRPAAEPQATDAMSRASMLALLQNLDNEPPPTYSPPAIVRTPQDTGAVAAAFGRAKDTIGQTGRASLNALRSAMSSRGISGSRYEGGQTARLMESLQGTLSDTAREQALHERTRQEALDAEQNEVNQGAAQTNFQAQLAARDKKRSSLLALAQARGGGLY